MVDPTSIPETLDVHPVQIQIWRSQKPWQRLELAMALSQELVEGNFQELRRLYPQENDRQLRHRFATLNYSKELADAAYGER